MWPLRIVAFERMPGGVAGIDDAGLDEFQFRRGCAKRHLPEFVRRARCRGEIEQFARLVLESVPRNDALCGEPVAAPSGATPLQRLVAYSGRQPLAVAAPA